MQKRHVKLKYSSNKRLVTVRRSQLPVLREFHVSGIYIFEIEQYNFKLQKPKIFFSKKCPLVGGMAVSTLLITRTDLDN